MWIAAGDMRREVAQAVGQRGVGAQRAILLGREGGHVDGVDGDAVREVLHHLLGDAHADDFLRLFGGAADVRGGQHAFRRE